MSISSSFILSLPRVNITDTANENSAHKEDICEIETNKEVDIEKEKITLLLVEDNPDLLSITRKSLQQWYHVRCAENGRKALELLAEENIDMIISDVMMPEMDGLEATRTIRNLDRKDCKKIPIYAMSANAFDEDVKRSLASGMNGHLSKPVNLQVLEKTLQKVLG